MFEITNRGMNEFLELKELGKIDHTCVYDFTFENRYLIYHYKISGMYQYVAFDTTTGRGSTICKRKERLLKTQFHSLIGDILYSIKYTGDRRHVKNYTLAPEELIPTNPAIGCKIPPKKAREMEILTHEEIQRFIIQAAYDGYYELFLLEFATGMRRGEICGLQWIDLDFDSGELKIRRQVVSVDDGVIVKKPKTKGSVRTVILDASLLRVLYELKQKSESQWIFPSPVKNDSPLNPQTVYRKTQQILERAQCKKVRFHDLRHTFATMSLENGMDIKTLSNMIGHSSVATTLDIYSHITDEMLKNASRTIDRGIGKANSRPENEIEITMKKEVTPPSQVDFEAYKGKIRKSGTGGIYKLNDHLYEGRYTPTNAYGKRESCNVYAKTYEECEVKLEEMIAKKRAEIAAEKERLKAMQTA